MANAPQDRNARIFASMVGAIVASNLASAVISKRKTVNTEEAIKVYQEVVEEMRKTAAAVQAS